MVETWQETIEYHRKKSSSKAESESLYWLWANKSNIAPAVKQAIKITNFVLMYL